MRWLQARLIGILPPHHRLGFSHTFTEADLFNPRCFRFQAVSEAAQTCSSTFELLLRSQRRFQASDVALPLFQRPGRTPVSMRSSFSTETSLKCRADVPLGHQPSQPRSASAGTLALGGRNPIAVNKMTLGCPIPHESHLPRGAADHKNSCQSRAVHGIPSTLQCGLFALAESCFGRADRSQQQSPVASSILPASHLAPHIGKRLYPRRVIRLFVVPLAQLIGHRSAFFCTWVRAASGILELCPLSRNQATGRGISRGEGGGPS